MRGQDRQTSSPRPLTILLSLISLQHPLSISLMSPIAPSSHPLYIVTGATGGIGGAVAEALAREGKTLVLACRNVNAAEALAHRLRNDVQGVEILVLHLDLSSFNGVTAPLTLPEWSLTIVSTVFPQPSWHALCPR